MSLAEMYLAAKDNPAGPFYTCPKHGQWAGERILRVPHEMAHYAGMTREKVVQCERCRDCVDAADAERKSWEQRSKLYRRWHESGIPTRFTNRRFANFRAVTPLLRKARDAVRAWADSAVPGLVLVGPIGTGKTHLAISAGAELTRKGLSVRYATAPDLFEQIRSSFSRSHGERSDRVLDSLAESIWILDEIGATTRTPWEQLQLSALIDRAYRDEAPFVLVGNVTPKDLPAVLGDRGADRLAECALIVPVTGASYRGKALDDAGLACSDDFDPGARPCPQICVRGVMEAA